MRAAPVVTAFAALFAATSSGALAQVEIDPGEARELSSKFAPPINLWVGYRSAGSGAIVRPHFSTVPGAYVTIVAISRDGRFRILYPTRPTEQRQSGAGDFVVDRDPSYSVDPRIHQDPLFRHDRAEGRGVVFGIASYEPFDFTYFTQGRSWSTERTARFGGGDPFFVVREFVDRVLPESAEYSLDYDVYEVSRLRGEHVDAGTMYVADFYERHFGYSSLFHYHNSCISAFGYRYSYRCRAYNERRYYPIIVGSVPRRSAPNYGKIRNPRFRGHEPITPRSPIEEQPPVGHFPRRNPGENAERQRRAGGGNEAERREPVIRRNAPARSAARRSEARRNEAPRVEARVAPRSAPRGNARAESRAPEPRRVERPPQVERPRQTERPRQVERSRPARSSDRK